MPDYWLDANVFIRPNRDGFYSLQLAPTFWQLPDQKAAKGAIASPRRVYQELASFGDDLAAWAIARRTTNLFVDPGQDVQLAFTDVANYVAQNYAGHKAQEFLGGADPWLIAHAIADKSLIVTYETRVGLASQTPKIPNVAQAFNIQAITLYRMFQLLGVSVEFSG
jgi:hypothetical protein